MLVAESLYVGYTSVVVRDANIAVGPGEVHVLLGPNGSGKSTLLRCLAGILPPFKGKVMLEGVDIFKMPQIKKRMGYMPEGEAIFRDLKVEQIINIMGKIYGVKPNKEILELTKVKDLMDKNIGALSMGQKRRVLLALALLHDPSVLITDEPTANLDFVTADEIRSLIKRLSKEGMAVVLSTHNISEAWELATHVTIILRGEIIFQDLRLNVEKYIRGLTSIRIRSTEDPSPHLLELGYKVMPEEDGYVITLRDPERELPEVVDYLRAKGVRIKEVAKLGNPLEELLRERLRGT